jgi:ribosomal protein S17E
LWKLPPHIPPHIWVLATNLITKYPQVCKNRFKHNQN